MIYEKLKDSACQCFNITKSQFESGCRKIEIVHAKIAITKVLHSKGYSINEISSLIGRDRCTIMHYLNTFDDRYKYDCDFRNNYESFNSEV